MIIVAPSFSKSSVLNVFRPHENEKHAFSNFSGLKSVLEKFRFREGLVWTVGLTAEIKIVCDSHLNTTSLIILDAFNCYDCINVFI